MAINRSLILFPVTQALSNLGSAPLRSALPTLPLSAQLGAGVLPPVLPPSALSLPAGQTPLGLDRFEIEDGQLQLREMDDDDFEDLELDDDDDDEIDNDDDDDDDEVDNSGPGNARDRSAANNNPFLQQNPSLESPQAADRDDGEDDD
ncbi:MAG: hypothetical protein VKJ04_01810 [Vampirovibrionales bacterium]|nr:hypothetical protein [Vampirovibrionales bacterium]